MKRGSREGKERNKNWRKSLESKGETKGEKGIKRKKKGAEGRVRRRNSSTDNG